MIRDLVEDADTVVGELARNKRDVGRFVSEARDTSTASAEREDDIATNFRKLPRFLGELTPTMAALGEAADEQRPVLVDLRRAPPTSRSSCSARPSSPTRRDPRSGSWARPRGWAARRSRPRRPTWPSSRVRRAAARPRSQPAHRARGLRRPGRAVEKDPRSPGGKGYSGAQALLRYVFSQSLVNNGYDELGLHGPRSRAHRPLLGWVDAKTQARGEQEECRSWLGPFQHGVDDPDPTAEGGRQKKAKRRKGTGRGQRHRGATTTAAMKAGPRDRALLPPPKRRCRRSSRTCSRHCPARPRRLRRRHAPPRLPPRDDRRPNTSIVASPVLVGSVTVLIVIVAVVLAYNANSGLPFVPRST